MLKFLTLCFIHHVPIWRIKTNKNPCETDWQGLLPNTINKIRANNVSTNNVIGVLIWAIGAEKVKLFTELCKSFTVSRSVFSINLCQMNKLHTIQKSFLKMYLSFYLDSCCLLGIFIHSYLITVKGPMGQYGVKWGLLIETRKHVTYNKQTIVCYI